MKGANASKTDLFEYMQELSKMATSQEWVDGFEYELWEARNSKVNSYGKLKITKEMVVKLNQLSETANGWIWMNEKKEPIVVSFKEFLMHRKMEIDSAFDWNNAAGDSLNTSEWFGAIFWYFYFGKRIHFNFIYSKQYLKRNAITGWIIQLSLVFFLIGLGLYFTYG